MGDALIRQALRLLATTIDDGIKARLQHGEHLTDPAIQREVRDRDEAIRLAHENEGTN